MVRRALWAFFIFQAFALSAALPQLHAAHQRTILITSFEPFAGRSSNFSDLVARELQKEFDLNPIAGIEVHTCTLPVVYDRAAQAAQDCLRAIHPLPSWVLSLGEGDCRIRLETAAHNRDNTPGLADNAGEIRTGSVILNGKAADIGFNLPVQELFCSVDRQTRNLLSISSSPGAFVCNNTAFTLGNELTHDSNGNPIQYGFIHVPPGSCGQVSDPQRNSQIISRMIRGWMRYDNDPAPPLRDLFPHSGNRVRMPTNAAELDPILHAVSGYPQGAECYKDFLSRLKQTF